MDNEKQPMLRLGQGTFTITNAVGETTGPLPYDMRLATLTPEQLRIAGDVLSQLSSTSAVPSGETETQAE